MLSVKEPPPEVIPPAVTHGLLHAALNLPARRHHLRVEQGEERRHEEEPLRVVGVSERGLTRVQEVLHVLRFGAGCRADGGAGLLPQVQVRLPRPEAAGLHPLHTATEVTGVTVDLRKLLKSTHVCSQTWEQLSLTGHDHVETEPETIQSEKKV